VGRKNLGLKGEGGPPEPGQEVQGLLPLEGPPPGLDPGVEHLAAPQIDLGLQKGGSEEKPPRAPRLHEGAHQGRKGELCQVTRKHSPLFYHTPP
jgi:hypothetical protein